MRRLTGMAPSNVKTVNQVSSLHIEAKPIHDQRYHQLSGQITPQSVLINKAKFFKVMPCGDIRKVMVPRSRAVEALSW